MTRAALGPVPALAVAGVLLLGACGGPAVQDDELAASPPPTTSLAPSATTPTEVVVTPGPDGVQAVTLVTQDNYRFVPSRFTVSPGRVRITLDNPSTTVHSLKFDPGGPTAQIPVVRQDETAAVDFTVSQPGEYQFICTFHVQFNQRGTMVVTG